MLVLKDKTNTQPVYAELSIKKSVFRAEVSYTDDAREARSVVKQCKERFKDARHVVHAFVTGTNGEISGCSDDGEPAGTAGQPVLAVLKGSGLTNVLVTVTRWFGGTLLGTGGLVKAYTAAAQEVLAAVETEELIAAAAFSFCCSYEDYRRIQKVMETFPVTVEHAAFREMITVQGSIPIIEAERFGTCITEVTKGASEVCFTDV